MSCMRLIFHKLLRRSFVGFSVYVTNDLDLQPPYDQALPGFIALYGIIYKSSLSPRGLTPQQQPGSYNNMIRRYLGASAEIARLILTSSLW